MLKPLILFFKAYIHGHYRRAKSGKVVWVDSYEDKRPERGRTEFAHWRHREGHFEHHLSKGRTREALHAFHDLNHEDSHRLAVDLGLAKKDEKHADKKSLMHALRERVIKRRGELETKLAQQEQADWEKKKAEGTAGVKRKRKIAKEDAKADREPSEKADAPPTRPRLDERYGDLSPLALRQAMRDDTAKINALPLAKKTALAKELLAKNPETNDAIRAMRDRAEGLEAGHAIDFTMLSTALDTGNGKLIEKFIGPWTGSASGGIPASPEAKAAGANAKAGSEGAAGVKRKRKPKPGETPKSKYTQSSGSPTKADPYERIDTRPGTTDAQRDLGRGGLAALAGRVARLPAVAARGRLPGEPGRVSGVSVQPLGVRLYQGLSLDGNAALVGQTIRGASDLAALAQVYRDPRFETLRAVFVDDAGKVVGESAYTSRLPGAVAFKPSAFAEHVKTDTSRFSASGYYLLHNHPSGNPSPSDSDRGFTREVNLIDQWLLL